MRAHTLRTVNVFSRSIWCANHVQMHTHTPCRIFISWRNEFHRWCFVDQKYDLKSKSLHPIIAQLYSILTHNSKWSSSIFFCLLSAYEVRAMYCNRYFFFLFWIAFYWIFVKSIFPEFSTDWSLFHVFYECIEEKKSTSWINLWRRFDERRNCENRNVSGRFSHHRTATSFSFLFHSVHRYISIEIACKTNRILCVWQLLCKVLVRTTAFKAINIRRKDKLINTCALHCVYNKLCAIVLRHIYMFTRRELYAFMFHGRRSRMKKCIRKSKT